MKPHGVTIKLGCTSFSVKNVILKKISVKMEPPYNPKYPQKIVIPPGTLNTNENNVLDVPGQDEEIFIATKARGRRAPKSSKVRPPGSPRTPRSDSVHTDHSLVVVGPEPHELETREQQNLVEDLKEFQSARRKLYYDVMTLQMTKLKKGVKKRLKKE